MFPQLRSLWHNLRHRSQSERELDDEMRFHLEAHIDDLVRSGLALAEARRRARIEFGSTAAYQVKVRESRRLTWLEDFVQDVHYGLRTLQTAPGFAAVAILTLAIGIGANTTIFSWIRAVLLNPLPGAGHPERVVALESLTPSNDWVPTSYLDFHDFRQYLRSLESLSVAYPMSVAVGDDRNTERMRAELVSANYFDLLQVRPALGRFFTGPERDEAQNAHPVVVISHSLWASHYHSDASVIGTSVRINRHLYTIIGVAPERFNGSMPGLAFQMWALATMHGQLHAMGDWMLQDRKTRMFRVLARLAPGVTIEQARGEVHAFGRRMAEANADTSQGMSATILPMWKSHYGIQESLLAPLSILMGASGVLLLIVCANVTNLLLARATSRQKEFSVRLALGAPRSRLIRQLLTESLLLSLCGLLGGLAIAHQLTGALQLLFPPETRPNLIRPPVDFGVFLFTLALTLGVALLAGMAPAFHAAAGNVNETLKEGGRGASTTRNSQRLRGLLVASEMALAVIALIGAGLFVRSFHTARAMQPGFDAHQVAMARFSMPSAGYDREQADSFCRRLREQLEHEPGVTSVSYSDYVPLSLGTGSWEDLQIEGYVPGPSENMKLYRSLVAPGYFQSLKIPLLQGRDFTLQDDPDHLQVMVVNQEFVRRFLGNQYPIGVKVQGWGRWFTIVGVAQDAKIYRLTENATPYFYVPIRQIYRPEFPFTFFVRTTGSVTDAIAALLRDSRAVDPASPAFDATSLEDFIAQSLFTNKIAADLLSVLAGTAILLAAIGLYSVMAYTVARRTNEIGIRVALGARPADVLAMVIRQGLVFGLAGLILGSVGAAALARVLSSSLVAVSPVDPLVYSAAALFAVAIVLAATAIPARRAMRVDPMVALRYE